MFVASRPQTKFFGAGTVLCLILVQEARRGHPTWQLLSDPNKISTMFAPILLVSLKNKGWIGIFPICPFTRT